MVNTKHIPIASQHFSNWTQSKGLVKTMIIICNKVGLQRNLIFSSWRTPCRKRCLMLLYLVRWCCRPFFTLGAKFALAYCFRTGDISRIASVGLEASISARHCVTLFETNVCSWKIRRVYEMRTLDGHARAMPIPFAAATSYDERNNGDDKNASRPGLLGNGP